MAWAHSYNPWKYSITAICAVPCHYTVVAPKHIWVTGATHKLGDYIAQILLNTILQWIQ